MAATTMSASTTEQETRSDQVAWQGPNFRGVDYFGRVTDYKVQEPQNYKELVGAYPLAPPDQVQEPQNYKELVGTYLLATAARVHPGATKVQSIPRVTRVPEQAELPLDRVRGVVGQVGQALSQVTLLYGDRENAFLFPTSELESVGAAYAGALFEVIVAKEGNYIGYRILHLEDEEEEARRRSSSTDLSFLDE